MSFGVYQWLFDSQILEVVAVLEHSRRSWVGLVGSLKKRSVL
jgi:hypothetical protein